MPGAGARPSVAARGASGYVEANGLRLHYLEYGRGEPALVIVPGITSPAITWEFVAEALARDRRVLTLDVRGRGLSDKPPSGYGLLEYSQDLAGFIQGVALERPLVLGHSMGARIAAALGATFPGAARALIVVDPPRSRGRDVRRTRFRSRATSRRCGRRGRAAPPPTCGRTSRRGRTSN